MHVNVTVTVIVVLYMLFMLYIGWASSKRIKSNSDFMVAGRRLGPILMAGTLTATEIGGGSSLMVHHRDRNCIYHYEFHCADVPQD